MTIRRQLCRDIINNVLVKSRVQSFRDILPVEERFALFAEIMHAHVFPEGCRSSGHILAEWQISRRQFSLWRWRHGGHRRFLQTVIQAAWSELEGIDYTQFNFAPLQDLLRQQTLHFCEMLQIQDQSACRLRLAGFSADLELLDHKLELLNKEPHRLDIHYRIDLLEHAFEAHITSRNSLPFLTF